MITPEQILLLPRTKANAGPGVYVFFRGNTVVYVGKSLHPEQRILEHGNRFHQTHHLIVHTTIDEMTELEGNLIAEFLPRYNKRMESKLYVSKNLASKLLNQTGRAVSVAIKDNNIPFKMLAGRSFYHFELIKQSCCLEAKS